LAGFVKDPDELFGYNEDPDMVINWTCANLLDGSRCLNSVGQPVLLNASNYTQQWGTQVMAPYNSYDFLMNCTKRFRNLKVQAILIIVEMDLPLLTT